MPTTLSIGRVRQRPRKTSIDSRKSCASTKIGVMSLKTIPRFGKLGTSRIPACKRASESTAMAGRLTGRQKSSTLAQSATRGDSKEPPAFLGDKRVLPYGLSDADASAGIG